MENGPSPHSLKLLTEAEVARFLRCSPSKIKRLRTTGKMAYLPGRPVLIESVAVERYLDSIRREPRPLAPEPVVSKVDHEAAAERARAAYQKYQLRQRNKNK
ncbi:helix-turn-helix domain-containing protein [Mesorhizobium sp. M0243]|uniref:helix-turn-helix domain-containing protein n=1 Tax=Mesorhizobium sp. M0243 TaxID=2956925 RepID=UPI003335B42B